MQSTTPMSNLKKAVIWEEWGNGSPMIQIARAISKPPATVFSYLRYHVGIQPRQRRRCLTSLRLEEREEISRGLAVNLSIRSIAYSLSRSPSTISREINRNGGSAKYRASESDKVAWKRAKRPKLCILAEHAELTMLLQRSLTWDRGTEMSAHRDFSVATNMDVYFCDPSSPWQRGINENTNGLLRQYFPKGSCMAGFSQNALNKIAEKLNQRPRKTLGFQTPADKLASVLQ